MNHCETGGRLHFPVPNPFIPTDFSLIQPTEKAAPELILDEDIVKMWYLVDVSFNVPKAVMYLSIESPRCSASPEDAVLSK